MALQPRSPQISTWRFIRTRLLITGGDYCYGVWRAFKDYLEQVHGMKAPRYSSFAKYWWVLKKLGFIEPFMRVRGKAGIPRVLYRVVPGKEDERLWPSNPQVELFGDRVRLGRRRYRRRVLKVPPKPVGRPPKKL